MREELEHTRKRNFGEKLHNQSILFYYSTGQKYGLTFFRFLKLL